MLDYVRFLKIGPPDCDVWGFPIEIRMMDLHTKYLLVAAYVFRIPRAKLTARLLGLMYYRASICVTPKRV